MLPTLVLGGALAFGQPPASGPFPLVPAAGQQAVPPTGGAGQPPPATEGSPKSLDLTVAGPATAPAAEDPPAAATAATRWPLMRSVQGSWLGALLNDGRVTAYGWTEFTYTTGTASGSNLPVPFVDRANEFLLNQNFLHVERTLDTGKRAYQWGFVAEVILPGSDYRFTLPRGLANDQLVRNDGRPELYGIDPFQFYAQAFLPDLGPRGTKVILGRFATHVGYELVQAVDTPFVSRAHLFQNNPFTHTGVWATSQLTDEWSMGHGFATGSDTFLDAASRLTYLGQVKWAPPTGRTSVTFNTVVTRPRFDEREAFAFYNVYDVILTHKLSDRLTYAADATYSHIRGVPDTGFTDWYGAAQYLTYQLTPTLATTGRLEFFNDTTGFRTGGEGLYSAVTAGLAWKPLPELLVRPSVRYDHNNGSRPFEGSPDLFTATLDFIVRW